MNESNVRLNEVSSNTILNGGARSDSGTKKFHNGQHSHYTSKGTMQGNIKSVVRSDRTYHARDSRLKKANKSIKVIIILLILGLLFIEIISSAISETVTETVYNGEDAYSVPMSNDDLTMIDFISGSRVDIDYAGASKVYSGGMTLEEDGDLVVEWFVYDFATYVSYEDGCLYMYDMDGYTPTLNQMKELQGYLETLADDLDEYYG